MDNPWNKNLTKENSESVRKISETMKKRGIDNFSKWRSSARIKGLIPSYEKLKKDGDLAELIGVILGDGNIYKFPRTECLRIVGNSAYPGFAKRYSGIVEEVFNKKPHVAMRKDSNAFNITIYQNKISERLGIPTGSKRNLNFVIPKWILRKKEFKIRFLRGLYESDGSYSVHKPTYTYKMHFSNANIYLLDNVFRLLNDLGFHPHKTKSSVQVSRKEEVQKLKNLLQFRRY